MEKPAEIALKKTQWVWIVVENAEGAERLLGQRDETHKIDFIPAFLEKETAQAGFSRLQFRRGVKYEIQAIIFEDLLRYAAENRFLILLLDAEGGVQKKIAPDNP